MFRSNVCSRSLSRKQIAVILLCSALILCALVIAILVPLIIHSNQSLTTTDSSCKTTCNVQQQCASGVCAHRGLLSCAMTWSRSGNGDFLLGTPNNQLISSTYPGSSATTDGDVTNGTGPENIYWSNSSSYPPNGIYYLCFSQFANAFTPAVDTNNPLTVTVTVVSLPSTVLVFTRIFTIAYNIYTSCDASSPNLVGNFTYP